MAEEKLLAFLTSGVAYAIPVSAVGEMVPLKALDAMPGVPPAVRGGVVIRDELIPVIDLRVLLGQQTLIVERKALVEVIHQREQDHVAWLEDLQLSVTKGTPFQKALDPTRCAFGQWYQSYKPSDPVVERLFKAFDEPHREIHALGGVVLKLAAEGKIAEATTRMNQARATTLQKLLGIFRDFKHALVNDLREIAVVLRSPEGRTTAIAVEMIHNILDLSKQKSTIKAIEGQDSLVESAITLSSGTIYRLDTKKIFQTAQM